MPVIDLRTLTNSTNVNTDVCVIGAGAAGLLLAASLARRGVSVVVLEAGGRAPTDERGASLEAVVEGRSYRGTSKGRAFGLGGTTTLWGGQLVPHSELDFRKMEVGRFDFWRHLVAVVGQYAMSVYAMFGLRPISEFFHADRCLPTQVVDALRVGGLEVFTADWLPFRKRNFSLLADLHRAVNGPDIFVSAPAVEWCLDAEGSGHVWVESVSAQSYGKTLTVRARAFALAAGAVESTRILLEMERRLGRPFRQGATIGRYLGDHLSCRVAKVVESDRARCVETFGPRFRGGRMRSFRIVERNRLDSAPRAFFHFIYENENIGFGVARRIVLALQSRTVPQISFGEVVRGAGGMAALAWNRVLSKRLHIPKQTPSHLQLDIEQVPNPANRISLSDSLDPTGRPRAVVRWGVSAADEGAIRAAAARFLDAWPERKELLPRLLLAVGDAAAAKPHDVYHPVGTCRMGEDGEAVVDPELRVHGAANLWLVSTAVFPSAGTANPTFSLLCLAAALAERLANQAAISHDASIKRNGSFPPACHTACL